MYNFQVQLEEKGASLKQSEDKKPGYWSGTGSLGGTLFTDRDRTRRSPSPPEIVELYRGIVFICSQINFNAFAKQHLKLYVTTRGNQSQVRLRSHQVNGVHPYQQKYIRSIGSLTPYTRGLQAIEEVTEHPLLEAVMHPNPRWDHVATMKYISLCLDLFGRSHWWMESFDGLRPKNVWPLLSQYMVPYKGGKYELVESWMYGSMSFPYSEVLEVRNPSARDPYALGVSSEEALFAHSDLFDMYISYGRNVFEQGAAPKMLVFNKDPDAPLGRIERERLQRDINYNLVRGAQGIAWVVDGNLDVKPMSFLPEGMAKLNIGNDSLKRVCNGFGVPVSFVDIDSANRSISETDKKNHAELAIDPRCQAVASAMTKWTREHGKAVDDRLKASGTALRTGYERLVWAFDNPVPEDKIANAKVIDMELRNGQITINEARALDGFPPVWYGNEAWIQIALTQPSIAKQQREQGQLGRDGKPRQGALPSNMPGKPPKEDKPPTSKPAQDETQEGSDEVVKPPKKGLPAPQKKAWTEDLDLAETFVRAALMDIGLGLEDKYEDEVLTQEQRLEALQALRMNSRALLRKLGEDALVAIREAQETEEKALGKDAKEKVGRFFRAMRRSIHAGIVSAALIVFGPGKPNEKELKAIREATARQVEYLDGFRDGVMDGTQALDGTFAARAELYGAAVWNEGGNLLRGMAIDSGLFLYGKRLHLPSDIPCSDCQEEIDRDWHPIEEVIPLGLSACGVSCHCCIRWMTDDGQEWTAGRGPLEEMAFGTR